MNSSQFAAITEAISGAAPEPGFLVVLGRQQKSLSERKLAAFAKALGIDLYTAKQRVLAPTPRVVRRETTARPAAEWAAWFRSLGLRAFDISEAYLAEQTFLPVATLQWQDQHLLIQDVNGGHHVLDLHNLSCAVAGEVLERTMEDRATVSPVGSYASSGGVVSTRQEGLLDLHPRNSSTAFRIRQDTFRWNSLFPEETGQSAVLYRRLIRLLAKRLPHLPLLQEFAIADGALGQTHQIVSTSSYMKINWLRPLHHLSVEQTRLVRQSNQEAFDLYSALSRMEQGSYEG